MIGNVLNVDIETYSSRDIKQTGVYAYTEAPDFEVLLIGYSLNGGPVVVLDMTLPDDDKGFRKMLVDPTVKKTAFNANFERTCLAKWYGVPMPPEQWDCTMVRALSLGLPASLEKVGQALGLPEDQQKLKTGKELIRYFCNPCKPTKSNNMRIRNLPEDNLAKWEEFIEYNRQDVITERAIRGILNSGWTGEGHLWCLDQRINDNGVRLDLDLAHKIVDYDENHQKALKKRAKELTGLDNPNSQMQLKSWIESKGIPCDSLAKADVAKMLETVRDPDVREVLQIRQLTSKTSTKKYKAMLNAACDDGRLRGILQFYGTRTGRWAGRLVQIHNLPQNHLPDLELARSLVKNKDFETLEMLYDSTPQVLSELVRTAFIPSEGCRFVVSDFSAIEARVTAWLAGEQWRLKVFEDGGDIYCKSASRIYGVPVEKHGINGNLRQKGKVAELACGYGGGVGAMKRMDSTGAVPEEEMQRIVSDWRKASPKIVKMWHKFENCAYDTIMGKGPTSYRGIGFYTQDIGEHRFLAVNLPSGRFIFYADPRVVDGPHGPRITYMGQDQTTRQWKQIDTYGGKLTENIVQAIARDCLAGVMIRVANAGYQIVMHVHDEIILDVPKEDKNALEKVNAMMSEPIAWAPGLPLKGDGYETDFYRKD